jgi:hypothetical protein
MLTTEDPFLRYRQALVRDASDGSFYLFGGESYKPYMYHNSLDRLQIAGLSSQRAADGGESYKPYMYHNSLDRLSSQRAADGGESYKPYMYHNSLDRLQIAGLSSQRAAEGMASGTGTTADGAARTASLLPAAAGGVGVGLLLFWLIRKFLCAPSQPTR